MNQESKNLAILNWIGTLFLGFIPGLILYLVKTDDEFVNEQSKEALNWSITVVIGNVVAFILTFIAIGALLFPIIALAHLVFCLMGTFAVAKGEHFRLPWAIRLLK